MIHRDTLLDYLNQCLEPDKYRDFCPNGLQINGRDNIQKVVTGVTASQALIDAAIAANADALLVHHGFFWKGEDPRLINMKFQRIKSLLDHEINLIAYHLPLDCHAEYGNNVKLADKLSFTIKDKLNIVNADYHGLIGVLNKPMSAAELSSHINSRLKRQPLHIAAKKETIETIAWCTGKADNLIEIAASAGVDAYLSGEISEPTVHIAREMNIHYFACGHHATERYGVQSLGQHLSEQFNIECEFIDIDNPV